MVDDTDALAEPLPISEEVAMGNLMRICMLLAGALTASAVHADCSVSADQGAVMRPVDPAVQADADLIISMSIVPKLIHLDYQAAIRRPACDLGPIAVGGDTYELWGGDSAGRQRKALPARRGGTIAMVIPIFDITKAIESAKTGKAAPTEGYLLATVTKADLTGWRFYTALPDVEVLRNDMTEALSGGGAPIFRNGADGKTALFVPKG